MSRIAEEVRRLEQENARLRAALKQVVDSIQGAADALAGETPGNDTPPAAENETPVSLQPRQQAEQTPMPEQEVVEQRGAPSGAYKVDVGSVLGGRML